MYDDRACFILEKFALLAMLASMEFSNFKILNCSKFYLVFVNVKAKCW